MIAGCLWFWLMAVRVYDRLGRYASSSFILVNVYMNVGFILRRRPWCRCIYNALLVLDGSISVCAEDMLMLVFIELIGEQCCRSTVSNVSSGLVGMTYRP